MKAPAFSYCRPADISQVFDLFDLYGDDARLLAGGQSLMAALNMRLDAPAVLIDLNGVGELAGIASNNGRIRIGAMTRHAEVSNSPLIAQHLPLLVLAAPQIAHPAIRNRGTFGGSIALADPAAEWPACCVALRADIVLASRSGERRVSAGEFFRGLYETARRSDEVLVAVEFAPARSGERAACQELAPRRGDYAWAGVAVQAAVEGRVLRDLRMAFFGVGTRPLMAPRAIAVLEGREVTPGLIAGAQVALEQDLEPSGDPQCSAQLRMHYARVVLARALDDLLHVRSAGR